MAKRKNVTADCQSENTPNTDANIETSAGEQNTPATPPEKPYAARAKKALEQARGRLSGAERSFVVSFDSFDSAALLRVAEYAKALSKERSVRSSLSTKFNDGAQVRIIGGEPRHIGMIGKIMEARRIRALVEVPGETREIYALLSDLELYEQDELEQAESEESLDSTGTDD